MALRMEFLQSSSPVISQIPLMVENFHTFCVCFVPGSRRGSNLLGSISRLLGGQFSRGGPSDQFFVFSEGGAA